MMHGDFAAGMRTLPLPVFRVWALDETKETWLEQRGREGFFADTEPKR